MDGSPVVFQRWDEGQPQFKNNDENCAEMTPFKGEQFKWINLQWHTFMIYQLNKNSFEIRC